MTFETTFTTQQLVDHVNTNYDSSNINQNQIQEIADHFKVQTISLKRRMKRNGFAYNKTNNSWALTTGQVKQVQQVIEKTQQILEKTVESTVQKENLIPDVDPTFVRFVIMTTLDSFSILVKEMLKIFIRSYEFMRINFPYLLT